MVGTVLLIIYCSVATALAALMLAIGGGMYGSGPKWWEVLALAIFWPLFLLYLLITIPCEKIKEQRRSRRDASGL